MSNTVKETGLTPEEAGSLIGCSAYTVKEMARGNRIPFYKVGNRYRFTSSTLMKWMLDQEKENYNQKGH